MSTNSHELLFTLKEGSEQKVSFESAPAKSAGDELDICRLSPSVCVVGHRIDLRRRRSPFRFGPPSSSSYRSGRDPLRELSRMTKRHALLQEATVFCRHTFEQLYRHTLPARPGAIRTGQAPRLCHRSRSVRPLGTHEGRRICSGQISEIRNLRIHFSAYSSPVFTGQCVARRSLH